MSAWFRGGKLPCWSSVGAWHCPCPSRTGVTRPPQTGSGIATLPLTTGIALRAVQLQDVHRDPADRFIIATALVHDAKLLTLDGAILAYPEAQDILVRS